MEAAGPVRLDYEEMLACSRCGTCLPACPSYAATLRETHSPRGRVQLLRALDEDRIEPSAGLNAALSACLDCRGCESVCPNGVHPGQMSVLHRSELRKLPPHVRIPRRFVLGSILPSPGMMEAGVALARLTYQCTGLQRLFRAAGLPARLPRIGRLESYLPPLPSRSVRRSLPSLVPAVGERRGTVGFFLGCAMNTIFADVSRASIKSLTLLGYDVIIPRGISCCGAPQVAAGEHDLAKKMARRNLSCFDDVDTIVTDCAACGAELKHYPRLLDDAAAESFSSRVRDFSEFVAPLMPETTQRTDAVTYHAPCHLAHGQNVRSAPEGLLKKLCADYRALPENDRCCGSAGAYFLEHPEIADHAQEQKLNRIRATEAQTVVTSNPGCLLQLMAGRTKADRWQVKHMSEVTLEALQKDGTP